MCRQDRVMEHIEGLRGQIDLLDRDLIGLLIKRLKISMEVGRLKSMEAGTIYDQDRENQILENILRAQEDPLMGVTLKNIYKEVLSASRRVQGDLWVHYLGPEGSFCHEALRRLMGSSTRGFPCADIEDVFLKTSKRNGSLGIVPLENSLEGPVNLTYDLLARHDLMIQKELYLSLRFCLMGVQEDPSLAKRIYSHPMALAQVAPWIKKNLEWVQPVEVLSTARAAQMASRDPESLALGPAEAAVYYNLRVLKEEIPIKNKALTRFAMLGHQTPKPTGKDKTSVLFTLPHRPGALMRALSSFEEKINLCLIYSRPIKGRDWEYAFFVDLEGHIEEPGVKAALEVLQGVSTSYKFLGSYPFGETC